MGTRLVSFFVFAVLVVLFANGGEAHATVQGINGFYVSDPAYTSVLVFEIFSDTTAENCATRIFEPARNYDLTFSFQVRADYPRSWQFGFVGFTPNGWVEISCGSAVIGMVFGQSPTNMLVVVRFAGGNNPPPAGTPVVPTPMIENESLMVFDIFKLSCPSTPMWDVTEISEDGLYHAVLFARYADGSTEQLGPWLTLYPDGNGFSVSAVLVLGESFPEGTLLEIITDRYVLATFMLLEPVHANFQGTPRDIRAECFEVEG